MPDSAQTMTHIFPLRVYYEDTDAAGIVYYANYLKFAERARTELLRELGVESMALMESDDLAFAVRDCRAEYLKPGRLDDALEVHTQLVDLGGASLRMRQDVKRGGDLLVAIEIRLACMNVRTGQAMRLPRHLRGLLVGRFADFDNATEERG
jgi:acyl-CoA thioester hydrolase